MALTSAELSVVRAYVAINGTAPTQQELADAFSTYNSYGSYTRSLVLENTQSNSEFVVSLYTNLLGREADAEGLGFWVGSMTTGSLNKQQVLEYFQFAAAVNGEDFVQAVDDAETALTTVGGEFTGNNDGGDTGEPDPELVTEYSFNTSKGESELASWTHVDEANSDKGYTNYESNTSKFFNVGLDALDANQLPITANYTFTLKDQLGSMGHYEAYFLSPILNNTTTSLGSQLTLEIIDRMADANDLASALEFVAIQSFDFYIDGERKVIGSQAILDASTYEELLAAVVAELDAQGIDNVEASLGQNFTRQRVDPDTLNTTGENVLGQQIVLTTTDGSSLERGTFSTGAKDTGSVARNVDPSGRQTTEQLGTSTSLISTNLVLENVGYGSKGGSINIAGQSDSTKGIQQYDITAKDGGLAVKGVHLSDLSSHSLKDKAGSAYDFLEVVNLTGDASFFKLENLEDVRAFNGANFAQATWLENVELTNALIERDLNLVDDAANPAADNVTFSYNTGAGDDRIVMDVNGEVIAHEDAILAISTGAGNDYVHLDMSGFLTNQLANHQALNNVSINAGSGNNTVWTEGEGNVAITTGSGVDTIYTDNSGVVSVGAQPTIQTLTFAADGADGDDETLTVTSNGATVNIAFDGTVDTTDPDAVRDFVINALNTDASWSAVATATNTGAGEVTITSKANGALNTSIADANFTASPVLATTQTGVASGTTSYAQWVVNGAAPLGDIIGNGQGTAEFLYNATLQVTYAPTDLALANVDAAALTQGFESLSVAIPTAEYSAVNQRHINQAIKEAINTDPVLSKLLLAEDGPNDALIIKSLIDGVMDAGSIDIDITAPNTAALQALTGADATAVTAAYRGFTANSEAVLGDVTQGDANNLPGVLADEATTTNIIAGVASTASSQNVVNSGAGDDVIVLGTNAGEADQIVFNTGVIGNNTIVDFEDGNDTLNFNAWLNSTFTAGSSTSGESVRAVATTVETDATFDDTTNGGGVSGADDAVGRDIVSIVDFDTLTNTAAVNALSFWDNTTDDFEDLVGLSSSQLTQVLNAYYDTTDLDGFTSKHIIMIQDHAFGAVNAGNEGHYAVIQAATVATHATGEEANALSDVSLIGSVDFGQEVTFTAADFA